MRNSIQIADKQEACKNKVSNLHDSQLSLPYMTRTGDLGQDAQYRLGRSLSSRKSRFEAKLWTTSMRNNISSEGK